MRKFANQRRGHASVLFTVFAILSGCALSSAAWADGFVTMPTRQLGPFSSGQSNPAPTGGWQSGDDRILNASLNGQGGWSIASTAVDQEVTTGSAHSGAHAWRISNWFHNGIVNHALSPAFAAVGESGTQTSDSIAAASNHVVFTFWVWAPGSNNTGAQVSTSLTDAAGRRMTYVDLRDDGSHVTLRTVGISPTAGAVSAAPFDDENYVINTSPDLLRGAWYRVVEDVTFVDGQDNDVVALTLYSSDGTSLWQVANAYSWEPAYFDGSFASAGTTVAINRVGYRVAENADCANRCDSSKYSATNRPFGFHFDDISAIPSSGASYNTSFEYDRWVAPAGTDSGDCSVQTNPCQTIAYAITQANAYDRINIASGQYINPLTITTEGLQLVGEDANNKPQIKRIAGGIDQPLLVIHGAKNVRVENLEFDMDQTFVGEGVLAAGFVDGLSIVNNHFIQSRSNSGVNSDYGVRNAISINDSANSQHLTRVDGSSVSITGNTIDGALDIPNGVLLRCGVDMDAGVGTIANNTITAAVHDIRVRFSGTTGSSSSTTTLIDHNTLNGRGLELDVPNATAGPITISNNHINAIAGISGTAPYPADFSIMRLIANHQNIPVTVSGNTFAGYQGNYRGVLVENFPGTTFSDNTFTPASGATDFVSLVVSNKELNSGTAPAPLQMVLAATGNTFNGSGVAGAGRAVELLNDNDAGGTATFGSLQFGGAGSLANNFDGNLRWYFHLDDYNCETVNTPTCAFLDYAGDIGSDPVTNTEVRPFRGNVSAVNNLFAGAAPSAATANALLARTYDKTANSALGTVDYGLTATQSVVYVDDSFASASYGDALNFTSAAAGCGSTTAYFGINAFATIADGISHVVTDGTVCVAKGSYAASVTVNKALQLIGDGNTATDTLLTGGITIDASGSATNHLLVSNLRVSNPTPTASGILVKAASYLDFQGLALVNNTYSGINLTMDADHITLSDSLIDGNQTGLRTSSTTHVSDVTITNTTFSNNSQVGLILFGGSTANGSVTNWSIDHSHFLANNNDDSGTWGSGIWLWSYGSNSVVDGFTVTNSTFADNGSSVDRRQSGIYVVAGAGGQMRNVHICSNTFAETASPGTQRYGIYVYDDYNYAAYAPIEVCANNVFNGLLASISGENQFTTAGSNPVVDITGGTIANTLHINTPIIRVRDSGKFATIGLAMNDAGTQTGDEIHAPTGLYHENVTVTHNGLTLSGDGASTVIDGSGLSGSGVTLPNGTTGVTLNDFAVRNFTSVGNDGGCIFGTAGNNQTTISGTTIANCKTDRGGIFLNGPVDTVIIDGNDISDTDNRGIVIWNGAKTHITITNNHVHDLGGCCGIELQDGSASGVIVTGNIIERVGDSGMSFIQLTSGAGANVITGNIITDTGRFGMEIKLPNGNGADTGDGSIVVENNVITSTTTPSLRDRAGIAVQRRAYCATCSETDVTRGVVVRNNTVSGFHTSNPDYEGYGVVVEGQASQVSGNTLSNNDVGLQVQQANPDGLPPGDADQNAHSLWFNRGNAPLTCIDVGTNTLTANTLDRRDIPAGASMAGQDVTNVTTGVKYCSITAAVDAATAGDHIQVAAGVHVENAIVSKPVVLTGAGQAQTTLVPAAFDPLTTTYTGAVIRVRASNVEVSNLTVDGINPNLAGHATDIAARAGIMTDITGGPYSNFSVHDTTVKNIYLRGIYAPDSPGGQGVSNFNFSHNTVSNVQSDPASIGIFSRYGTGIVDGNSVDGANDAISANWSKGTTFNNNTVTNSASGIHSDNNGGGGGVADTIENNTVDCGVADAYGVWVFANYADTTVRNNTVTHCAIGLGSFGGRTSGSPPKTASFIGNVVNGTGAPVSSGDTYGAYLSTTTFYFGDFPNNVVMTGNTITGFGEGVFTERTGTPAVALNTTANFNRIVGNTTIGWDDGAGPGTSDFQNNWWGCNGGPNASGCDGATAGANFAPWLVLSLPASPINIARDASIQIPADFNHNSNGDVVNASAVFPNGTSVAFSADNGAGVTSPQTTTSGVAITTFSGLHLGQSTVTATYENAHPTVVVQIAPAMITLDAGTLSATYDGQPHAVTATTTPAGLSYVVTYDGSATVPTNAGSYNVVASVTDNCCQGTASGTLVIARAATTAVFAPTSIVYDGSTHVVTATLAAEPATQCTVAGSPVGPNASSYTVQTAVCNGVNYTAPASSALIQITPANATFVLSHLVQAFDGAPKSVLVTPTPTGLSYSVSYVGTGSTVYGPSTVAPTQVGTYTATATSADPNYSGSNSATLQIVPSNGDIALVVNGPTSPVHVGDKAVFAATMLANPALHQGETYAYEVVLSKSNGSPLALSDIASMEVFYQGNWVDVTTLTGGTLPFTQVGSDLVYTFPDGIPGYTNGFPITDPSWTWNVRFSFATIGTYTGSWTLEDGTTHATINPLVTGSAAVVVQPALPPTDIHLTIGGPAENVQTNTPAEYSSTMLADPSLHVGETYFVKVTVAKAGGTHALAATDLSAIEIYYQGSWQALPANSFVLDGNGNLVYFFPQAQEPGGFPIQDSEWTWNFRITYADTGVYTTTAEVIHAADAGQASPQVFASDAISTTVVAQVIVPPTMNLVLLGPVDDVAAGAPAEYTGTLLANPADFTGRTFWVRVRLSKNGGADAMTTADLSKLELYQGGSWIDATAQIKPVMVTDGNDLVYYFPQPYASAFSIDSAQWSWHFRFTYADSGVFAAAADVIDSTDLPLLSAATLANATTSTNVVAMPPTVSLDLQGPVSGTQTGVPTAFTARIQNAGGGVPENVVVKFQISRAGGNATTSDLALEYFDGTSYQPLPLAVCSGDTTKLCGTLESPSGFPVAAGYDGTTPLRATFNAADTYTVQADVAGVPSSTVYASDSLVTQVTIISAQVTIDPGSLLAVYDGNQHAATATTTPSGLSVQITYDGSTTAPINAGSYNVVATITQPGYVGSTSGTLVIAPASVTVTLSDLTQIYDGTAKSATVTTSPSGIATSVTYDGNPASPSALGSYTVVATVTNPNYSGSASGTLNIVAASAPNLAISITDDRDYVQYGKLLTYKISVSNIGNTDITGASISVALPATVLPAQPGWTCLPLGAATCGSGGNGALNDTANIPAGGGVVYLLNVWTNDDQLLATDEILMQASVTAAGDVDTSNNSATDLTTMVIFRDGFEEGGDGAQVIGFITSTIPVGSIDAARTQGFDISAAWSSNGQVVEVARVVAGKDDVLAVQAIHIGDQLLVRLAGYADAKPIVGAWSSVPVGTNTLAVSLGNVNGHSMLILVGPRQDLTVRLSDSATHMSVIGVPPGTSQGK